MGLSVFFVSGPRRAGKSSIIRAMIDRGLWRVEPHYLRLVERGGDKTPPKMPAKTPDGCGVATARTIEYDEDRVFEVLPEALQSIHRLDRYGAVVIEADADPVLRCAYPYDHRLFVMPVPERVDTVFRSPEHAALELRRVLDDTNDFASSIFGVLRDHDFDHDGPRIVRPEMTASQLSNLLHSPLGEELATRMALQPTYHGMLESDVVLVNRIQGNGHPDADCIRKIERLMERLGRCAKRQGSLHLCDPFQLDDPAVKKLFKSLRPMCVGGK
jgi:hypothetical protein